MYTIEDFLSSKILKLTQHHVSMLLTSLYKTENDSTQMKSEDKFIRGK